MRENEARTGNMHQNEGLGDWQNLSFDKRMTKTSFATLTVPARFVRQHGDKVQKYSILQSELEGHLWTVKASVSFPHGRPQVMFSRGWKAFVVFNGLVKGDRMRFTLVAKSKFKVSISRSSENSKAWPRLQTLETSLKDDSQRPPKKLQRSLKDDSQRRPKKLQRSLKDDSQRRPKKLERSLKDDSQRRTKKLLRPQYFGDITEKPELRCDGLVAKDCEAVKAETVVHSISNAAAATAASAGPSLSGSSDMDSHFFEPVQATASIPFFYS